MSGDLRHEAEATLAARQEVGEGLEPQLVDRFVERVEQEIERRAQELAAQRRPSHPPPAIPAANSVFEAPNDAATGPVRANETGTRPADANQSRLETRPSMSPGTRRWSSVRHTIPPEAEKPKRTTLASIACHTWTQSASAATAKVEPAQVT